MSLLGDDFIDNCKYSHEPHGDIQLTAFDFEQYGESRDVSLDSVELLSIIDEIITSE